MLLARVFFCCSRVSFKATAKGKGRLAASIAGDIWLHAVFLGLLAVTVAVGVWQMVAGAALLSPLLISVLWAVHGAVAPALLLLYAAFGGPGLGMHIACRLGQLVTASGGGDGTGICRRFKGWVGLGGGWGRADAWPWGGVANGF